MLFKTSIPRPEDQTGLKSYATINHTAKIVAKGIDDVLSDKEAASKKGKYIGEIVRGTDGRTDLRAEIAKRPNALWVKAKAIEADKENDNGDFFSRDELVKSYKTFEGVPIFTNHQNSEVENAKGKVVLAEWDERTGSVYCTFFVDREAHPDICRMIEEGYITDVSMGTQVDYSTCSICGNRATTAENYCNHVKNMKGRTVDGKKVFERNFGLKFIELSIVTDGACPDCTIRELVDPEDFQVHREELQRAAANNINRLVATGAIQKEAGQQEIQDLNEAMDLVTGVIQSMLAQRQFIDLEFMQKLGEVLAELQHQVDELVDQGYENVGEQTQQPQASQPQVPPMPETAAETGAMPPAAETQVPASPGGVGKVTEPMAASKAALSKFSASVKDLRDLVQKISSETKEHTGGQRNVGDKSETIRKLATIWGNPSVRQFTTEVSEGDFKIVVGKEEVIGLRGGHKIASVKIEDLDADIRDGIKASPHDYASHMLDALQVRYKSAVAEKAPTDSAAQQQQTFEAQLESQRPPLHPREKDIRESVTEDQLKNKRDNYSQHARKDENKEEITEKQLRSVPDKQFDRQDNTPLETQELQLRDKGIKGNFTPADQTYAKGVEEQLQKLPEKQLDQHRGGEVEPRQEITEKQLGKQDNPWGRRIASKEDAKVAIAAASNAMAKTVIATGATPDELVSMVVAMTATPSSCVKHGELIEKSAGNAQAREQMLRRASFHGRRLDTPEQEVKEYLLGTMADKGFIADVGMTVLSQVARKANAVAALSEEVKKEQEPKAKTVEASASDFLSEALSEEAEETVRVDIPVTDIKADKNDKDAFAKAAFEFATKVASTHGMKVTKNVSVSTDKKVARVSVLASKMTEDEKKVVIDQELKARKEARRKVVAQTPGGGGGAMPGVQDPMSGGGGTTMPAAPMGDPTGAGMPPVGALSAPGPSEVAPEDDKESAEAKPPGSVCPACGSEDVDVENGEMQCNGCGAKGTITVKIELNKWPGSMAEKGPEKPEGEEGGLEGEAGIGDMAGGPGLEMPNVGVAASFKVTPEMVKKANNKPIGSFCPTCGSSKVKLALKQGAGRGECENCGNTHKVDVFVGEKPNEILARVEWTDLKVKRLAQKNAMKMVETSMKAEKLEKALAFKGMTEQFKKASFEQKAKIVDELLKKGLLD